MSERRLPDRRVPYGTWRLMQLVIGFLVAVLIGLIAGMIGSITRIDLTTFGMVFTGVVAMVFGVIKTFDRR
jgi:uncharacterized oligopeptide transporter (OPT) family protein